MLPEPSDTSAASKPPVARQVIILAHPDPASFNASMARTYAEVAAEAGHEVVLRDLYRIPFDPVLKVHEQPGRDDFKLSADVAEEIELIAGASAYVLVYPIWFGTPPAMMKGYVERVLGAGVSPRAVRERVHTALLGDRRLLSLTSSGNSRAWLEEQGAWTALRNTMDIYLRNAFGARTHDHLHLHSISRGLSPRFVREELRKVRDKAVETCGEIEVETRRRHFA